MKTRIAFISISVAASHFLWLPLTYGISNACTSILAKTYEQNLDPDEGPLLQLLQTLKVIKKERPTLGSTNVSILTFENGARVVYRPYKSFIMFARDPFDFYSPHHDVNAFKADRAFGFNVVPATIFGTFRRREGSFQNFVEGKAAHEIEIATGTDVEISSRIFLLDLVIMNLDRRSDNLIVSSSGFQWGIDNNKAFYASNHVEANRLNRDFRRKALKAVRENRDVLQAMRQRNESFLREHFRATLNPDQVESLISRVRSIVEIADEGETTGD